MPNETSLSEEEVIWIWEQASCYSNEAVAAAFAEEHPNSFHPAHGTVGNIRRGTTRQDITIQYETDKVEEIVRNAMGKFRTKLVDANRRREFLNSLRKMLDQVENEIE